jgi:hypothetical protein
MQFSMKQLLLATAFVAIASFTLVYATPLWASLVFTASVLLLLVAVLMTILTRGQRQATWIGILVFGVGYWAVVSPPVALWGYDGHFQAWTVADDGPPLITSTLLRGGYFTLLPLIHEEPAFNPQGMLINNSRYPDENEYMQVGHALFCILFALAGGWLARTIYSQVPREPQPRPSE